MHKLLILSVLILLSASLIYGHEGHQHTTLGAISESIQGVDGAPIVKEFHSRPESFAEWIGGFHFIILHFPIALINMAAIAEFLYFWTKKSIFDLSATFMLITAAILIVPTALFGYIYSTTAVYHGLLADFLWWHMWFGISTAILTIVTAYLKVKKGTIPLYYILLFVVFFLVNITSMLGGAMTHGPKHMLPPIYTIIN